VFLSGLLIMVVMMATAFLGYVLPWGQQSMWGAVVITNFFTSIPYIGETLTLWIWGGYAVGGPTLMRFYTLHFMLPFLISGLIIMHMGVLHHEGSSNPLNSFINQSKVPFSPYFTKKDALVFFYVWCLLCGFVIYYPLCFGEADNFTQASELVTPEHIMPEWYFLFAYTILRSVPNKAAGLVGLVLSIAILSILPMIRTIETESSSFWPLSRIIFWALVVNVACLTWLGTCEVESPYVELARGCTIYYFLHFIVLLPLIRFIEYKIGPVVWVHHSERGKGEIPYLVGWGMVKNPGSK
jgi:ubiquinol-cytochrome c reductase cytochrome b subunit